MLFPSSFGLYWKLKTCCSQAALVCIGYFKHRVCQAALVYIGNLKHAVPKQLWFILDTLNNVYNATLTFCRIMNFS